MIILVLFNYFLYFSKNLIKLKTNARADHSKNKVKKKDLIIDYKLCNAVIITIRLTDE